MPHRLLTLPAHVPQKPVDPQPRGSRPVVRIYRDHSGQLYKTLPSGRLVQVWIIRR